jgi:endonuclease G
MTRSLFVLLGVAGVAACGTVADSRGPAAPARPTPAPTRTPTATPTSSPTPRPPANPSDGSAGRVQNSEHVALGVPKDGDPSDDYLLDEREFVVSYNARLNAPNWVAWRLESSDLGHASRSSGFRADARLPSAFYHVKDDDYVRSGYDRGHMCPSADRTRSADANLATFVLSNAHPQLHALNAGPWEDLENESREIARSGKDLYVVAGGLFDASPKRIGRDPDPARRVAVPRASFKIAVVVDHGAGLAGVTSDSPAIAVVMPNDRTAKDHRWRDYACTIRDVERASGYDFDGRVPRALQDAVETRRAPPAATRN